MDMTADHARRMEGMMRLGTVKEIDCAEARVRVETGGILTDWLPWHTVRAGGVKHWSPPTEGEQVLILAPSGELSGAYILGGFYSDDNPAPSGSPDETKTVYPDGATLTYNHATGKLTASGIKSIEVTTANEILIDCPMVTFTGDVSIQGSLTVENDAEMLETLTVQGMATFNGGTAGDRT